MLGEELILRRGGSVEEEREEWMHLRLLAPTSLPLT